METGGGQSAVGKTAPDVRICLLRRNFKKDIRLYTDCGGYVFGNHDFAAGSIRYENAGMVYDCLSFWCSSSFHI